MLVNRDQRAAPSVFRSRHAHRVQFTTAGVSGSSRRQRWRFLPSQQRRFGPGAAIAAGDVVHSHPRALACSPALPRPSSHHAGEPSRELGFDRKNKSSNANEFRGPPGRICPGPETMEQYRDLFPGSRAGGHSRGPALGRVPLSRPRRSLRVRVAPQLSGKRLRKAVIH